MTRHCRFERTNDYHFRRLIHLHFEIFLRWLSFRDFKMTIPLGCSDCSPSCQPQNVKHLLVIYNRKYDTLNLKKKVKHKLERHFCFVNERHFKGKITAKKLSKSLSSQNVNQPLKNFFESYNKWKLSLFTKNPSYFDF